jgi:hypothetical protein
MVAIAGIANGSISGIKPRALMVALSTVAVVDGGSNNGVFTTKLHYIWYFVLLLSICYLSKPMRLLLLK